MNKKPLQSYTAINAQRKQQQSRIMLYLRQKGVEFVFVDEYSMSPDIVRPYSWYLAGAPNFVLT
jgi:hypothetical protein